jgi:uncharacterized membrane protein
MAVMALCSAPQNRFVLYHMTRSEGSRQPKSRMLRSTPLHVAVGFVVMGGWAAFANRGHGLQAQALVFVVQGLLSGTLMLLLKRGLEAGYARLAAPIDRVLPPVVSCIAIANVLWLAHTLAGTPEILTTIAVPWSFSTLYGFIYVFTLPVKARKEQP